MEDDLMSLHCLANAVSVADVSSHNLHFPLKSGPVEPALRAQRVIVHKRADLGSNLHETLG
jgi:hypothetical protein